MLVGHFFPRHGILRETLEQKDTISDARAKNHQKHVQNMRKEYTPRKKIWKILPKSMWILWRKSPKNLNLCLIEGFFNMKHIQRTIYPVTSVLHNNHRDLCVPSLKLVRRHGPIFVAEIDQTALISGRIWPKILVRHGPDLKMLWELCIKDVVNNEELLMDKIW